MSNDTAELLDRIAEENDVPNYDIIDAHIEPEDVRIPSGQDLDKEAVIAARRCEIKNLLDFEAFEWVREEDVDPAGRWINSRWEDVAKNDPRKPPVRSRRVLQEIATRKSDDYFAATPTTASNRIIDMMAVQNDWPIADADVTTAFLHAREDELIYTAPADCWRKTSWCWRLLANLNGRRTGAKNFSRV